MPTREIAPHMLFAEGAGSYWFAGTLTLLAAFVVAAVMLAGSRFKGSGKP